MQRFFDKWGLWFAFFIVGGIIAYGLIAGLLKPDDQPSAKNKALQDVHGNMAPGK